MRFLLMRTLLASAFLCVGGPTVIAQQPGRPTPDQARAMLANPQLVEQIRQRIMTSGLSADQIRARLRAEGYPDNLLDAYLPGATTAASAPGAEVFSAVELLGIADSADVAVLQTLQGSPFSEFMRDSLERMRAARRRYLQRADVADSVARADSGYNIFGLDVFDSPARSVSPNLSGPVDANYRLGPGDRLVLILTGDVEAAHELNVTREGFVVIPQVGRVDVANLTLGDLENLLFARLGRVYSGVRRGPGATTRFSVSVARVRTVQIFVLGDVKNPGSYTISGAGTAISALYAAGGPTAQGSLRSVLIRRGNTLASTLDLYDYLLRGDASNDVRLESGDVVFVPPRGLRVRIVGEVVRPATYELKATETLADLIRAAGGFQADASRRRVQIERILPPEQRTADGRDRVTIDIESDEGSNGSPLAVPVQAGDVVRVFPVAARVRNTVVVQGNVWSPGRQGLSPGMTVADAVKLAGGLKPDVYLGQVLVDRLRPDGSRVQLRATFRDTSGAVIGDFPLTEDDVVRVFSITDFRPDRYVTIGGAVRNAGRFPYRQGMTMRDLVLLAGGLEESAYLKEAEIARLPENRSGIETAKNIRVPLDSTYLFERKPGEPYLGAPGMPASANGAPEVALMPYDNVLIMHQPSWELQRLVTVAGEVNFPGTYALRTRDARLADVIEHAGGLTTEAYPEGTVFIRANGNVGRVAIDVPRALRRRDSPENLLLMDGDVITVPQRSNVVTVKGAVNAPTVVAYVPGRDISYYIQQAGGPTRSADYRRAWVTQPSGKRETSGWGRAPKPMPGSLVEVPELDPSQRTNWVQTIATMTPVVVSLVSLIISLSQ
jgi:protein involved in polysaccharide export with SLBB domain